MTLDALIILAGAFVTALPFLGFPNSWDNVLLFIVGIVIVVLGIVVRRRIGGGEASRAGNGETFVENDPRTRHEI